METSFFFTLSSFLLSLLSSLLFIRAPYIHHKIVPQLTTTYILGLSLYTLTAAFALLYHKLLRSYLQPLFKYHNPFHHRLLTLLISQFLTYVPYLICGISYSISSTHLRPNSVSSRFLRCIPRQAPIIYRLAHS